jgi:hypothetical protein
LDNLVSVAGWVAAGTLALMLGLLYRENGIGPHGPLVEFYETRDELSRRRPLKETLKLAREVWALWIAGTVGWANDVYDTRTIRRLLLPNPYSPGFVLLARAVKRSPEDVANSVRGVTREAQKAGVEVRWFSTLPVSTVMIGDPEDESGWVQVEALFHSTGASERFSLRFTRKTHPRAFRHIKQSFEAVWIEAVTPDKAEEIEAFRRSMEAGREQNSGLERIAESFSSGSVGTLSLESASKTAAKRLAELSGHAVDHLMNRTVSSDAEQDDLEEDRHRWIAEIVAVAEQGRADISDVARLKHIGTYSPKGLGHLVMPSATELVPSGIGPLSELIARNVKHRNEVAERNERLVQVIKKLEKR